MMLLQLLLAAFSLTITGASVIKIRQKNNPLNPYDVASLHRNYLNTIYRSKRQYARYPSKNLDSKEESVSSSSESIEDDECEEGFMKRFDGKCIRPKVTRNILLFNAPSVPIKVIPPSHIPAPQVHYNYVFVKVPKHGPGPAPIVVPPPQERTLVYLLSKNEQRKQKVIEIEAPVLEPEVYFVNYDNEDDNQDLPGGIDLRTALKTANVNEPKSIAIDDDSFDSDHNSHESNDDNVSAKFHDSNDLEHSRESDVIISDSDKNHDSNHQEQSHESDDNGKDSDSNHDSDYQKQSSKSDDNGKDTDSNHDSDYQKQSSKSDDYDNDSDSNHDSDYQKQSSKSDDYDNDSDSIHDSDYQEQSSKSDDYDNDSDSNHDSDFHERSSELDHANNSEITYSSGGQAYDDDFSDQYYPYTTDASDKSWESDYLISLQNHGPVLGGYGRKIRNVKPNKVTEQSKLGKGFEFDFAKNTYVTPMKAIEFNPYLKSK